MRKNQLVKFITVGSVLLGVAVWAVALAQEAEYHLAHRDIYGKLRRPPVYFSHERHADALTDGGCGVCHHARDDQTGKLVYVEGEEIGCKECHLRQKSQGRPALREAYHGSCTGCHRRLIKRGNPKIGPTTCGGCHKKP